MQSRWVKRWNSYFFRQKRIGFDDTSSAVTNMSWYLLYSIFSKRKSLSIATVKLFNNFSFFLPFGRKRYFEATKNCTRWFTRNNIFFNELVFAALYILQMTIRERSYSLFDAYSIWSGFSKGQLHLATRPVAPYQTPV